MQTQNTLPTLSHIDQLPDISDETDEQANAGRDAEGFHYRNLANTLTENTSFSLNFTGFGAAEETEYCQTLTLPMPLLMTQLLA